MTETQIDHSRVIDAVGFAGLRRRRVRWAWADRIPLGGLTVVAGMPGLGKSTLTYSIAAQITRGTLAGDLYRTPSAVLSVSLEDGLEQVQVGRFQAAGGDLDRMHGLVVREFGSVVLPDDTERIEELALELDARMLIVDPITAAMAVGIDGHRDASVRGMLAPLATMSERCDLAVVVVMHLNKGESDHYLHRVGGSIGFTAAARSVIAFARDPDDPDGDAGSQRIILHAKSNYGRHAETLTAAITTCDLPADGDNEAATVSKLEITGESSITVDELSRKPDGVSRADAEEQICTVLVDGEKPSIEVKAAVTAELGCSRILVEKAAQRLVAARALTIRSEGFPRRTVWSLADPDDFA